MVPAKGAGPVRGADPAAYIAAAVAGEEGPQVDGGPSHFTQGMYGQITFE